MWVGGICGQIGSACECFYLTGHKAIKRSNKRTFNQTRISGWLQCNALSLPKLLICIRISCLSSGGGKSKLCSHPTCIFYKQKIKEKSYNESFGVGERASPWISLIFPRREIMNSICAAARGVSFLAKNKTLLMHCFFRPSTAAATVTGYFLISRSLINILVKFRN